MLAQTKNHQTVATVTCQTQDFIVDRDHRAAAAPLSIENCAIGGSVCIALLVKELSDVVKVEMDSTLQCSASF